MFIKFVLVLILLAPYTQDKGRGPGARQSDRHAPLLVASWNEQRAHIAPQAELQYFILQYRSQWRPLTGKLPLNSSTLLIFSDRWTAYGNRTSKYLQIPVFMFEMYRQLVDRRKNGFRHIGGYKVTVLINIYLPISLSSVAVDLSIHAQQRLWLVSLNRYRPFLCLF